MDYEQANICWGNTEKINTFEDKIRLLSKHFSTASKQ